MKLIRIRDIDQNQLWHEYKSNGGFEIEYGGKLNKVYDRLVFWINTEEYNSEDSFGFIAGYGTATGEVSTSFDIPDSVIEAIFPADDISTNTSESYHEIDIRDGENAAESMARVANTLVAAGFEWAPDCF